MKPVGSITKDFPFLDEDIRNEIESTMNEARDYWDFIEKLGKKASHPDCSALVIYLSLYHASRASHTTAVRSITEVHLDLPLPSPFFHGVADEGDNAEIIQRALELIPNQAIRFYLMMRLYRVCEIGSPEETRAKKMIESLLRKDQRLRLHAADYYGHYGMRLRWESQPESALLYLKKALRLARKSDDQWHQSLLLTLIAEVEGQYNKRLGHYARVKRYLGEAIEISKALGDRKRIADILQTMAVYAASRGEMDECLKCQLESVNIQSEFGNIGFTSAHNLSGVYADIGDGKSALEWAKMAAELQPGVYSHLLLADIYIQLEKIEEAESTLDAAKALVLKEGLEFALGRWYDVNARLERKRGDLDSALDQHQRALEIHEKGNRHLRARICLKQLTEIEVEMFNPTKKNRDMGHSGPYMKKYEQDIIGNDLPGHEAQLLLLKAELRMKQGRHQEGQQLLDSVLKSTNYPAIKSLHEKAVHTREKWINAGFISPRIRRKR
ncbi:MAG: hypothetical protein OEV85_03790 [Candidatus Thorarchaeota archaeon]|nr:hypothetical protein [Candidatus Thorarchaeota archaeon]